MKKKILTILASIIVLVFLASAIFTVINKPKTAPEQGVYRQTYDIRGASFSVNSEIVNQATAVSEISDKINIDPQTYYLYKDGESNYLLFGLETVVVAVEKNTSFGFTGELVEEDLYKSDVAGLWFEKNGVKLRYENEGNKYIIQANGGLGITDELYSDYTGKLVVMNDNGVEYSIFVGVPGTTKWKDLDKEIQGAIDTIALSLEPSDVVVEIEEENYEVVISGNGISENDVSEDVVADEKITDTTVSEDTVLDSTTPISHISENAVSENIAPENIVSDNIVPIEETASENNVDEPVISENVVEEIPVNEEIKEEIKEDISDKEPPMTEEEAATKEESATETPVEKKPTSSKNITVSNQKEVQRDASKAYSSDIYTMLKLKDNGIITEYDYDTGALTTPIISVKRIYTGDMAIEKIKTYCDSTSDFNYFDAPVGCTWHVAEYAISYLGCASEPYINIKLKGIDGEPLVYRGIKYSKRCYDIGNYCFYAVPNGCTEYALECGEGNIDNEESQSRAAYYKIQW